MAARKTYPAAVKERMKQIRETAKRNPSAICWRCGKRPYNGRWNADHIFPILGDWSPLIAACEVCNKGRSNEIPYGSECRRLFHDPYVVRSIPAEALREMAVRESTRLFGSRYWIEVLIAATKGRDGKTKLIRRRGKQDKAANDMLKRKGFL